MEAEEAENEEAERGREDPPQDHEVSNRERSVLACDHGYEYRVRGYYHQEEGQRGVEQHV